MAKASDNRKAVGECVGLMAGAFRQEVDAILLEAYRIGLMGLTEEQVRLATAKVLQGDFQFMPPPGQLRQLALTGGVSLESRADIAWHEFDRAVASHGGDHSVTFDDGLINATVTLLGGWILCCEKTGDDYFVWLQKQFKQTYVRLCNAPRVTDELRRPLVGRTEMENSMFPDRILGKLRAYTGAPLRIGTSQPVLQPPAAPPKRIARTASSGPLQIGEVVKQLEQQRTP